MSEWYDKGAILPSGLKHVLKQGMKILGVSVNWKWDRLVTYWLALVNIVLNNIDVYFYSIEMFDYSSWEIWYVFWILFFFENDYKEFI